jgi:predicted DNA-binding transcriptional regulator YafY
VYLFAVVILVSAMRQGPTPRRVRELTDLFDIDRRTIYRWRDFWNDRFPQTKFWQEARARLVPVFKIVDFPRSLLEAFVHAWDDRDGWENLLRFLSPITTTKGLEIKVSENPGQPAEDANGPR